MDPAVSPTRLPILADWHARLWTGQTQLTLILPNRPWENRLISLCNTNESLPYRSAVTQSSYTMGAIAKGQLVQYRANHMAPWKIGTYVSQYWKTMDERVRILGARGRYKTVHVPKKGVVGQTIWQFRSDVLENFSIQTCRTGWKSGGHPMSRTNTDW
ncbi:hypothetical protein BYT27DRAFT_7276422 [Phlegmacium glaucopus]|nr:hypothetical protein BYT27DRAFT_7276422 [Phlegmacium glaucopus]